jgi:hypothetical protein
MSIRDSMKKTGFLGTVLAPAKFCPGSRVLKLSLLVEKLEARTATRVRLTGAKLAESYQKETIEFGNARYRRFS